MELADEAGAEGAVQVVVDEATLILPLAGVIDVAKEQARLTREIDRLGDEIAKLDAKLSNEGFLAKAPEDVVVEQRERRDEALQAKAKLGDALARLAAM
jgi:valyl-tRNA synthetase